MPSFGTACVTFLARVSYENNVTAPLRSLRKNTRSSTHIGEKSLELSRGSFSMRLFDIVASQIGVVWPPRYRFQTENARGTGT